MMQRALPVVGRLQYKTVSRFAVCGSPFRRINNSWECIPAMYNQRYQFCSAAEAEKPESKEKDEKMIPKVNENEISDKVKDVAARMLKLDFISLCQFMDLLKSKTGIDPNSISDMASSGGGGGGGEAKAEAAAEVADTGFRKIIIREFTSGTLPVKEKFAIMKLMRAEQDLSLPDVSTISSIIIFIFYKGGYHIS